MKYLSTALCIAALIVGCNSPRNKQNSSFNAYDLAVWAAVSQRSLDEEPKDNSFELIEALSNAREVVDAADIFSLESEARVWSFARLFDSGDPSLFERVFFNSDGFSGKFYAMLALWSLDRDKYYELRSTLSQESCHGILLSSKLNETHFLLSYDSLMEIESGQINLELLYVDEKDRRERHSLFLEYLESIDTATTDAVSGEILIDTLAHASGVYSLTIGIGYLELDSWALSYSHLVDSGDPIAFERLFEQSKTSVSQIIALGGLFRLDRDKYERLKANLIYGEIPYAFYVNDQFMKGNTDSNNFLEHIESGAMHLGIYVSRSKRDVYRCIFEDIKNLGANEKWEFAPVWSDL